ncbi:MAG TPA: hypothetical protein VEK57_29680 [Thermoanaerobaculia bacterium]|nr:hypothetical protein [Thermoanaerobaculia bacterium]
MQDKDPEVPVVKGSHSPIDADVQIIEAIDPTGSPHHAKAAAILEAFDNLEAMIDDFVIALPGRRTEIAVDASLPDAVLHRIALGCKSSPQLTAAVGLTSEEIMDVIHYTMAYRSVETKALLFGRGMGDTIAEKRATVAARCVQALKIARQMARKGEKHTAVPYLAAMEEAFKARRRRNPQSDDERNVTKTLRSAKRRAQTILVELNTTPQAKPTTTQFKAGRDLEP